MKFFYLQIYSFRFIFRKDFPLPGKRKKYYPYKQVFPQFLGSDNSIDHCSSPNFFIDRGNGIA